MATEYNISTTGSNRKVALQLPVGGSICTVLPSGITIDTSATGMDAVGDFTALFDVPDGAHLQVIEMTLADLDTGGPTSDLDLVLRVGTTDTVLLNSGGTLGGAAYTTNMIHLFDQYVDATAQDDRYGQVGLKTVATATTGVAAGAVTAVLWYR